VCCENPAFAGVGGFVGLVGGAVLREALVLPKPSSTQSLP